MIHYVYIDGNIYLQDVSLFDFGSNFFSLGRFYRVKSSYKAFIWDKYALYITNIKKINDDKIELTFTDPMFTFVSKTYTLARGYVNYNEDDKEDDDDKEDNKDNKDNENNENNENNEKHDISPVGWYVKNDKTSHDKYDQYVEWSPIYCIEML